MNEVRYRVRHRTIYQYTGRVDLCHNIAHLTPREEHGLCVLSHRVDVSPHPDFLTERNDYFGNHIHYFSIQGSHKALDVVSQFTIAKPLKEDEPSESGVSWNLYPKPVGQLDESGILFEDYLLPTPSTPHLTELRELIRPLLELDLDAIRLGEILMNWIHSEFTYHPGATDTRTPLPDVLEQRAGVCQDFAHVMIACLRMLGLPARYVSGYLETMPPPGMPKLQGADASHAWVEMFVPGFDWLPFDPTNNRRPGDQHIKLCHGRDYFDVQPLRGIFLGSGNQMLQVEVDVERL